MMREHFAEINRSKKAVVGQFKSVASYLSAESPLNGLKTIGFSIFSMTETGNLDRIRLLDILCLNALPPSDFRCSARAIGRRKGALVTDIRTPKGCHGHDGRCCGARRPEWRRTLNSAAQREIR